MSNAVTEKCMWIIACIYIYQVVIKAIYYHHSENEKKIHKINNNLQ